MSESDPNRTDEHQHRTDRESQMEHVTVYLARAAQGDREAQDLFCQMVYDQLRDAARKFFATELVPHLEKWRKQGMVDKDIWPKLGAAGFLGASIPESYGGSGGDSSHDAIIFLEHLVGY